MLAVFGPENNIPASRLSSSTIETISNVRILLPRVVLGYVFSLKITIVRTTDARGEARLSSSGKRNIVGSVREITQLSG